MSQASSDAELRADGLSWRAPAPGDVPAWAEAVAAVEAVDRTGEVLGAEDLADQLDLSYFDAANDARLVWAADEVVAYGMVESAPRDRQRRVMLDGAVRPGWRDRGLGSALIAWQVARGRELAAGQDLDLPGWLELTTDENDEVRAALFAEFGFAPLREYLELRRSLADGGPDPVVPADVCLIPYDFRRDEAVRAAHNEAFADHWGSSAIDEETWTTWCTGHRDFRADASFIALDGDEVAGYVINSLHPDDWPALGFTEGWTHQLGVRREWRGRGIAKALLAATMTAFAREGLDVAALDVDAESETGALDLYVSLGYERDRCRVAWSLAVD